MTTTGIISSAILDDPEYATIGIRLRRFLQEYRKRSPKIDDGPKQWAVVTDGLLGAGTRAIIGIPTKGCQYARTTWGGCAICGHNSSMLWDHAISNNAILKAFDISISALAPHQPRTLCLYTSGSFLDTSELPKLAQHSILRRVEETAWISHLVIESLPYYLTSDSLRELVDACPTKKITIAMGLDSSNEGLRHHFFQRHITSAQYQDAVALASQYGIETAAYIVHKHPFLNNEEAINDTATTLDFAYAMGFRRFSIEPVALQSGTLQSALSELGLLEPPTIWTVIESIIRSSCFSDTSATLHIGGQFFTPLPNTTISACANCIQQAKVQLPAKHQHLLNDIPRCDNGAACCDQKHATRQLHGNRSLIERTGKLLDALESLLIK